MIVVGLMLCAVVAFTDDSRNLNYRHIGIACGYLGELLVLSGIPIQIYLVKKRREGPPAGPKVCYKIGTLTCSTCGEVLQLSRKAVDMRDSYFKNMGLLGWLMAQAGARLDYRCPKCGPIHDSNIPLRAQLKPAFIRISLFLLAIIAAVIVISAFSQRK